MNVEKDMIREENTPEDSRQILRDPIGQIVGYLLSEDPTYITNCHNARALIRKIDRDELMGELVKNYLELD